MNNEFLSIGTAETRNLNPEVSGRMMKFWICFGVQINDKSCVKDGRGNLFWPPETSGAKKIGTNSLAAASADERPN